MPTKVLVFESDPAFAGELRTELGRLGLVAQVVDDGNAGLVAAAAERPDLILLSIELPRMNGFSVCNKLKKDPALKDVPLIIMSSDSSDETFEQHRKLRTRAEGYVHKPIAFGELLEHMRPYVELENGDAEEIAGDDAGILIDDDIEIEDAEQANGTAEAGEDDDTARIDREVEAFADNAFDRLLEEPHTHPSGPPPPPPPPPAAHAHAHAPASAPAPVPVDVPVEEVIPSEPPPRRSQPVRQEPDPQLEMLRADLEQQKGETARFARELGEARAEIERLEQAALDDSGSSEQVVRLQRELDELRLKAASGAKMGGVSSREFLDLRESLNKKDKEILGLRDQITRKEKEVLDVADAALALERAKADLEDQIEQLEKDAQGAKGLAESLRADKEQAAKRAEDFKGRAEKLKTELEGRVSELGVIQKRHDEEFAEREAEFLAATQQAREEREREALAHKNALEGAARESEEKLARALEQARQDAEQSREEALRRAKEEADEARAAAVAAREAELVSAHDQRVGALINERDQRVSELTAELEREKTRLETELAHAFEDAEGSRARLQAREKELEAQRASEVSALRGELEGRLAVERGELESQASNARAALEKKYETERFDLEAGYQNEKSALEEKHTGAIAELEAKHASEKNEIFSKHASERSQLEVAHESVRRELESRVSDLSSDLSLRTEERETLAREVLALREKLPLLESELGEVKSELSRLRESLVEQQRRNEAMLSRWNLNRSSLESAKDAIAAAVAQIEEAEVRGLE